MNNIWWVCNGRCANLSSNFLLSLKNGKTWRICQQICTWMGWLRWWSYRQQQDSEEWPHGRCCRRGPVVVWIHGIHDMLGASCADIHVYDTQSIQDLPLILLKCQHGVCLLGAARCQGSCKYWQETRIFDTGVLEKSLSLFVFVCVASAKDHW